MREEIQFEGLVVVVDTEVEIQPGDMYMAKRNTGWKLLTCDHVDKVYRLVIAQDLLAYAFTLSECKKVVDIV